MVATLLQLALLVAAIGIMSAGLAAIVDGFKEATHPLKPLFEFIVFIYAIMVVIACTTKMT